MNNILLCDHCGIPFNTIESTEILEETNEEREEAGLDPVQMRLPLIL